MKRYRVYLHFEELADEMRLVAADSFAEAVMAAELLAGDREIQSLEVELTLTPVAA